MMIQAIINRRSIRKYKTDPLPQSIVEEIIKAGILAPSSKNRQPWRFVVTTGDSKEDMILAMEKGLEREKSEPLLPGSAQFMKGAEHTLMIMKQAPVVIFIVNILGAKINQQLTAEERIYEICNALSIGAAIQNMALAATELGIGSLWICDTYFSYRELADWLGVQGEMLAAMAIGYADENPSARPREEIQRMVEWR